MMGLIGMGNNPMVGATVAVAVAVEEAMRAKKVVITKPDLK
ncbi:MAG: GGGtGRT protein [Clostridia bacterium]|nr:GGGtGRT protein [Clostridia bacterium]MBO5078030.1 GGGtGRT protein [Clostridia bacterium]